MSITHNTEKKRKRDRTTDSTQRKAPKLAGTNTDEDFPSQISDGGDAEGVRFQQEEGDTLEVEGAVKHVPSAFAHIKNTKKRHKLEKEARKARKDGTQEQVLGEGNNDAVNKAAESVSHHETTSAGIDAESTGNSKDQTAAGLETRDLDAEPSAATIRKPKRKKEKQNQGDQDGDDDQVPESGDDNRLRKHSAVLSKFQKATQIPKEKNTGQEQDSSDHDADVKVVHELAIPHIDQSEKAPKLSEQDLMPQWLAQPTLVPSDSRKPFEDLNLDQHTVQRLAQLGYSDALPVQQALIPLLLPPGSPGARFLPGSEPVLPDLAVSAPTGSGKTIAYLLPIVESLRSKCSGNGISAVVIVPTRELVAQVAAVAESLAKGSKIRIGTATGSGKLRIEQERIVHKQQRYDPVRHRQLMAQAKRAYALPFEDLEERRKYLADLARSSASTERYLDDAVNCTPDHVYEYRPAVDILVATPGRLLEHITSTIGFNLTYLQWLVIDEADKILDHQNESFLEALNAELRRPRTAPEQTARERFLRLTKDWNEHKERRMRKVVLSATMTRDISKILTLELRRPRLLVIRGNDSSTDPAAVADLDAATSVVQREDKYELPRSLEEFCVPVGDGSEKPLILLQLLIERIIGSTATGDVTVTNAGNAEEVSSDDDDDSLTSSEDDSDSDSDSDSADSMSTASASSESDSDDDHEQTDSSDLDIEEKPVAKRQAAVGSDSAVITRKHAHEETDNAATILIFTSSNESAHRLSYLLKTLKPAYESCITTLTKTKTSRGVQIRSKASEPAIVISTDRAARGIDSFSNRAITHVIQYNIPRSLTSYIHRVGRTARAGRKGKAWTLYTNNEARWFMNDITKSTALVRANVVEKEKIFMADEELRKRYKVVLGEMREEVFGTK